MEVLAHSANAFSCSPEARLTEIQAAPPIVFRDVNCIPLD